MLGKIGISFLLFATACSSVCFAQDKFKNDPAPTQSSGGSSVSIKPAPPTHYAFISTSEVLNLKEFLISAREISVGLGANFMLFGSPWNGRIGSGDGKKWGYALSDTRIGVKYKINSNALIGGGLNLENGQSGLAMFFVAPIVNDSKTEIVFQPSGIFKFNEKGPGGGWHSIAIGVGGKREITNLFSVIGELRFANQFEVTYKPSINATFGDDGIMVEGEWESDEVISHGALGLTAGLRIVPPPIPFMYVDIGFDMNQYLYNGGSEFLGAYLDLGFGFSL